MLRLICNALRPRAILAVTDLAVANNVPRILANTQNTSFSTLIQKSTTTLSNHQSIYSNVYKSGLLNSKSNEIQLLQTPPYRSLTKFSLTKGKRKAVKTVVKRFFRLHWGGWIRTRAGRHRHLWKKSKKRQMRLRQHVFVNASQSWLLDSMVTKFWRKPKYYVDDPYEPYHTREEFPITRRKPAVK